MADSSIKAKAIIGIEIHVQLRTKTKLFCGCPVQFAAPPNSNVCPVCLGHPGALPVINRLAVEYSIRAGLALGCEIAPFTKWDRKSYYYPDLPKNYQISQYDLPLAEHGCFEFPAARGGSMRKVRIKRAHLEEDAGKNIHDTPGCTLVDLNRTGTPLLEIVTEPDISSAEEAYTFCTELGRLVTYLGISEGLMSRGHMRFEPNVNVAIEAGGKQYRTPISEIKNLNSFRSVRAAIDCEIKRQVEQWQSDNDYLIGVRPNENRGWSEEKGVTEYQRVKEAAHDYRYFPDPDLVPVTIGEAMLSRIKDAIPELPLPRRGRLVKKLGLTPEDAATIVADRGAADCFDKMVEAGAPPVLAVKQFINVWLKMAADRQTSVDRLGAEPERMAELVKITAEGVVNSSAVGPIAEAMLTSSESPASLAETMGLVQVQDADATAKWVDEAFAANAKAVQDALGNPKKAKSAAGFLRGQVMKVSGGKADPKLVGELISRRLVSLANES